MDNKSKQKKLNEQLDDLKNEQAKEEEQENTYYQNFRNQSKKIMASLYSLGANDDTEMQRLSEYMATQDLELSRLLGTMSKTTNEYFQGKKRQLEHKAEE